LSEITGEGQGAKEEGREGKGEEERLVEANGPTEGPRRVQAHPTAPGAAEFGLGGPEQLLRHAAPLPARANRHPPEVTFPRADEVARDRPDDLAGGRRRDEHDHHAETLAGGVRGEHRVLECRGRVQLLVRFKGRPQTPKDRGRVLRPGPANGEPLLRTHRSVLSFLRSGAEVILAVPLRVAEKVTGRQARSGLEVEPDLALVELQTCVERPSGF
jgi:hypothetical protein